MKKHGQVAERALASMSESTRRLNPHLSAAHSTAYPGKLASAAVVCRTVESAAEALARTPKRIRQSSAPLLNKLETEFYNRLKAAHPAARIWQQAMRFRLGNGIWYKPDFAAYCDSLPGSYPAAAPPVKVRRLWCWEVKGPRAFRGGFENLKVAAGLYPEVTWVLVWKDEQGTWMAQEVLP